jgi:hypothetical protein
MSSALTMAYSSQNHRIYGLCLANTTFLKLDLFQPSDEVSYSEFRAMDEVQKTSYSLRIVLKTFGYVQKWLGLWFQFQKQM